MLTSQYTMGSAVNWALIPGHMRESVDNWILHGTPHVGSFLEAMLCNDLRGAVEAADDVNRGRLHNYVMFFFNYAPTGSWGSRENFRTWIGHGGLVGLTAKLDAEQRAAAAGDDAVGEHAEQN